MQAAQTAIETIESRTATIVKRYEAQGELELMFCRQIASNEITFASLERLMAKLNAEENADDRRIDRVSRAQARAQRMITIALKELKDLQDRRNIQARFHDQTQDCPPLADHRPFIGEHPQVRPIPRAFRGRMVSPVDPQYKGPGATKNMAPAL